MLIQFTHQTRRRGLVGALAAGLLAVAAPAAGQGMRAIDPDQAIDGDLDAPQQGTGYGYGGELPTDQQPPVQQAPVQPPPVVAGASPAAPAAQAAGPFAVAQGDTYKQDDLIGAAEGLFGKGAEGLARLIEDVLAKQGEPNAYIVGREAGGAFVVGARYGSGTLFHRVEGQRPVYWTGPSIGFDAGANAGNTFVLVYNLYDTNELYERFPAGEGQAYLVGGFTASYLRKGDIVLIPIRVGAGLRLGINAGYMKFSREQRWLPF